MADENKDKLLGLLALLLGSGFIIWRLINKKHTVIFQKQTDERFEGRPDRCGNIIYKPLSPWGPVSAGFLGRGWCYRGDGSFFGENIKYGDKYTDVQAELYKQFKTEEALRCTNKSFVQFVLRNTSAEKLVSEILNTTTNGISGDFWTDSNWTNFKQIAVQNAVIRNYEQNNLLGSTEETPMYLVESGTDGDGQWYIVRNMPYNSNLIEEPNAWALWSMTVTGQPDTASRRITKASYLGTYNIYSNCCKLWTYSAISGAVAGHQMALIRPRSKYIYTKDTIDFPRNTGSWNATTTGVTGFFKRSTDGKYCMIVDGYNSGSSVPKTKHHLFSASDIMGTWTDETGPASGDMFAGHYPSGYYGFNPLTSIVAIPTEPGYYVTVCAFANITGGNEILGMIKFNDTFTDISTFIVTMGDEPELQWEFYQSLAYWKGKWYITRQDGTYNTGKRKVFVADTYDGTYNYHSTIVDLSTLSDRSMLTRSFGGGCLQVLNNKLFFVSSGEGYSQYSGNQYNHEAFLWYYNEDTKEWEAWAHPLITAKHGTGFNPNSPYYWTWAYDHLGVISSFYEENNKLFFAVPMCGGADTYQCTCGYIDLDA